MLDGRPNKHTRPESLESRVRRNSQARFGGGPTEQGHLRWYLAGGLPDSVEGVVSNDHPYSD